MNTTTFLKREWPMWILILIPTIFSIVNWNNFPDQVPTHWGMNGEVDRYNGKWAVFLGTFISTGVYLLMLVLPKIDPRKKNYDLFTGAYWIIRIALILLLCVMAMITDLSALGYKLNVGMIVMLSVLGLFLLIGNQFGRIRPNYFVGIRTPWTLNNEEVWMKTHRLAGKVWVAASLVMILLVWFIPFKIFTLLFIAYMLTLIITPFFYSYRLHKKENRN
jgi:uncharacterized membrane protein